MTVVFSGSIDVSFLLLILCMASSSLVLGLKCSSLRRLLLTTIRHARIQKFCQGVQI